MLVELARRGYLERRRGATELRASDALLEDGMTLHLKLPSALEIRGEVRHVGVPVAGRRRYGVRFHKIGFLPTH